MRDENAERHQRRRPTTSQTAGGPTRGWRVAVIGLRPFSAIARASATGVRETLRRLPFADPLRNRLDRSYRGARWRSRSRCSAHRASTRDGQPVAFDTRKAMALLAHLALADRPRSREALCDLLWPGHDPEHARGALRRTLSTLRKAVGEESIDTTGDSIALVRRRGSRARRRAVPGARGR